MKSRIAAGIAVAALSVLGLAACSTSGSDAPAPAAPAETTAPGAAPVAPAASDGALMVADSPLGSIVVDGNGAVVYQFDADTQGSGASACSGSCLGSWPPVPGGAAAPKLEGITGEVGTITGTDGQPQLALNGWPLYYYAGDTKAGETNGQGVGGKWWVLTPAGEPVRN